MRRLLAAFPLVALVACGPSAEGPRTARPGNTAAIAKSVVHAVEVEATRPANEAFDAWMAVLVEARETVGTRLSREAALAALDALTGRDVFGFDALASDIGLVHRVPNGQDRVIAALDATLDSPAANDPYLHSYVAEARVRLASAKGDAAGVEKFRKAAGCATEATVVGPFAGNVLSPLFENGPVDGGTIAASYPKTAPLAIAPGVFKSTGRGCDLDTTGTAKAEGLRYLVVDVDVPSAQTISIGVDSQLPARVFANGKQVLALPYGELVKRTVRFGQAKVDAAGSVRLVVKLGAWTNDSVSVFAFGADGAPLATHAAAVGSGPTTPVTAVAEVPIGALASVEERVTWSLGKIATGDVRLAESPVAEVMKANSGGKVPPAAALVLARTLSDAHDIPVHRRLERQRAAYDAVLASWPSAWEAIVGHAQIVALQRRGGAGEVEAIAYARTTRDKEKGVDPMVDAYLALVGEQIYGVREDSLARVLPALKGTWLAHRLERATAQETDEAAVKRDCAPTRFDLGRFDCANARFVIGDYKGVLDEIERLRKLTHETKLGVDWQTTATLKLSGPAAAKAIYDGADPGDRTMRSAIPLVPAGDAGLAWLRDQIRMLEGDARSYLDVLEKRRSEGDASGGKNPANEYDEKTKTLVAEDRKKPYKPEVGTLIVAREEHYDLQKDGFLHAVVWDVRRVSGTQDVESNAVAGVAGTSGGIGWMARVQHRIFKADGTIVEPDRIAAAQAGAELSQIEPGDYVELVSEGWFLPRADGTLDLDTSDLLPSRTAVENAKIELTVAPGVPVEVWTHPELGKPQVNGDTRTWALKDHDVRRLEKGQAAIDAQVSLRLGTWGWERLGREALESVLADNERLPEVSAWVHEAVGKDTAPTLDLLVRLEKAAKKALPRVGFLPLGLGGIGSAQNYTARTVLLDAQGSRVELVHRALDEIGVKNEIVWAETMPYSSDPKMVARPWRFSSPPHALLVAWVATQPGSAPEPVWVDLDVDGSPPPPGRTSPELRGRFAITTKGEIVPVPPNPEQEPDLATLDVTVDDTGRGKGTFALMLRGRDAQDLSAILEEEAGDDREDALRAYVLAWVPESDVLEVKASAETWQVLVTAKVELPSLLVPDGNRFAIHGTPPLHLGASATTLGGTYAGQAKRTTALTIKNAIQYQIHRVIRLPKGTSITTPLPAVDVKDKTTGLEASRKVKVDAETVMDDFGFSLPTGVVPATAFDAFTGVAKQVDDGFASVVRVQPPPGAIKPPNVNPKAGGKPALAPKAGAKAPAAAQPAKPAAPAKK